MEMDRILTDDELKILCVLTLDLVRLRQNECHYLCIENVAPALLKDLIAAYLDETSS